MRVLLDTDVILDLLLDRPNFAAHASAIWEANEQGRLEAYISAITPVNVFYVARKLKGNETAKQAVKEIVSALRICILDQSALSTALDLPFTDYEDAVQHAVAHANQLDAIVTRNVEDYRGATIPVIHPQEMVKRLSPTS